MHPFLLGRKVGMTQIFADDGKVIPITVIQAGPCIITQIKSTEKDGYSAVQIGFEDAKKLNKPETGHLKNFDKVLKYLAEIKIDSSDDQIPKIGNSVGVSIFNDTPKVTVRGVSKGKGFAGVIKRHNFSRGPETHGSDHHRAPGSIGSMFPQHTLKGRKLPGHMGNEQITVKGLDLVSVDVKNNLMLIKGAIPGTNGSLVEIEG